MNQLKQRKTRRHFHGSLLSSYLKYNKRVFQKQSIRQQGWPFCLQRLVSRESIVTWICCTLSVAQALFDVRQEESYKKIPKNDFNSSNVFDISRMNACISRRRCVPLWKGEDTSWTVDEQWKSCRSSSLSIFLISHTSKELVLMDGLIPPELWMGLPVTPIPTGSGSIQYTFNTALSKMT